MESSALGLGGERGGGRERDEAGLGGEEVLGNNPRRNICQTSTHTHFEKSGRCEGASGNRRRSALTAAGCFPWKKRSQANPAGVKFHRSLTCNDITKHSAHPPPPPRNLPPTRTQLQRPCPKAPGPGAPGQRTQPSGTSPTLSLPTRSFLYVSKTCR